MIETTFIYYYLISNLLSSYIICKFFKVFFKKSLKKVWMNYIVYGLYFLSTSFVYLIWNEPLLTMLTNIVFLILITLLYEGSLRKKLTAVVLVYTVSLFLESCLVLIGVYFQWNKLEILSIVISRILLFSIVEIFSMTQNLKQEIIIPKLQWFYLLFVPIGSIALFLIIITPMTSLRLFIVCTILFILDVSVFYVFDKMNLEYKTFMGRKIELEKQKIKAETYLTEKMIYENQLKMIEKNNEEISLLKHDLKGHYFTLQSLLNDGKYDEASHYLDKLIPNMNYDEIYIDTGNTAITSILNYYIGEAKKKGVRVSTNIQIPEKIDIEDYDLSAILINLLQNAMEALEKCHSSKQMEINLRFEKNVLYVMIENSINSDSLHGEQDLHTTKQNESEHGFGIRSVKNSIAKYDGDIQFVFHKDKIQVFALLYNKKRNYNELIGVERVD